MTETDSAELRALRADVDRLLELIHFIPAVALDLAALRGRPQPAPGTAGEGDDGRPVVALDYCGVIMTPPVGAEEPDPRPGSAELVDTLTARGYRVVVYTTLAVSAAGAAVVRRWLEDHGYPPLPVTAVKPDGIVVDDFAVRAPTGADWVGRVMEEVQALT